MLTRLFGGADSGDFGGVLFAAGECAGRGLGDCGGDGGYGWLGLIVCASSRCRFGWRTVTLYFLHLWRR